MALRNSTARSEEVVDVTQDIAVLGEATVHGDVVGTDQRKAMHYRPWWR